MAQVVSEQNEMAVVILWDWSSVQVPLNRITFFIHKVRLMVDSRTEQRRRECAFLVFCDARSTPAAVTREMEKSVNVDIHHVEAQESTWGLNKKLHRFYVDFDPGVVVLISGSSTAYRPELTKMARYGWRVQLIHPLNNGKEMLERVDESCSIDAILDGDVGSTTVELWSTAYFALSEMERAELVIEELNSIAEKYESKLIYFNELAGEAVIELRAFDIESAISLLTARLRAKSPANGAAPQTVPYHLQILPSAAFLANINISKVICDLDFKPKTDSVIPSIGGPLETAATAMSRTIGPAVLAPVPYPLNPLNFIQHFAFPYLIDVNLPIQTSGGLHLGAVPSQTILQHPILTSPSAYNAVAASVEHTATLLHEATTMHPYAVAKMAAAAAAARMLQPIDININSNNRPPHFEQQPNAMIVSAREIVEESPRETSEVQEVATSNCTENLSMSRSTLNADSNSMRTRVDEEDTRSHREAKIEVFSEDEEDFDITEGNELEETVDEETEHWESSRRKTMDNGDNISNNISEHEAPSSPESAEIPVPVYVSEYPSLPVASYNEVPLRYSAVVKGVKPYNRNNNNISTPVSTLQPNKEVVCIESPRSACASTSLTTQMSQWDEVVVERGGKFSKPAPQCIHWNNPKHRLDFPCRFWHPREQCRYYPNCSSTADECGFAHPFCADFCHCPKGKRDPQKNHRLPDDRYFGGGDRVKFSGGSTQ